MRILVFTTTVLLLWSPALQASTIEQQRDWFQQARKALDQHHTKRFQSLQDKLADYALTPYLDIWHAGRILKQGDDRLVEATLIAYADVPETIDLRRSWLKHLTKKGRWADVQRLIKTSPRLASRFPEIAMMAGWYMSNGGTASSDEKAAGAADALRQFTQRWKQGKATTALTKPLYKAWLQQGYPTDIERWYRIGVFVKKGQWRKTRVHAHALSKQQQAWLKYWQRVQQDPEKVLAAWPESLASLEAVVPAALIIRDGIKRLSRRDPVQAWRILHQLQSTQKQIAPSLFFELERVVALRAARQHKQVAALWLAGLPLSFQNKDTHSWQVRLAIINQDWPQTLLVIRNMPTEQRGEDRWVYWQAHAMEASGNHKGAEHQYLTLATGRGYYNLLSAEKLGLGFQLESSEIAVSAQLIEDVENMPAIRRASEWLALNKRSKAIREWHFALSNEDTDHWKAAALIASRWGWDDQVIRAAFKADEMDALLDRFPMSYEKQVMNAARETGLKPASIWSVIRQESAFNQHAVSYVGAKGLMQLMPATARQVARKLKMAKGTPRLFSAATNIRLGSNYLAGIKQRFGSLALAAAGYNAGPHRVSTWLERVSYESPEAWVEAIPFNETRRYVQQVMAFVTVYEWRQNKELSSLVARLHAPVQKKVSFNQQSILIHDVELR